MTEMIHVPCSFRLEVQQFVWPRRRAMVPFLLLNFLLVGRLKGHRKSDLTKGFRDSEIRF